jgi:phospholipid/cholesterol/gamma-HCH transport system substrate-binding protein
MRSKRNLPIFLGYTLAALLLFGFLARQMGGEFFLQPVYHVRAIFATGSQLVAGDDVTIAGLRVGRVDSLAPGAGGTVASLAIHPNFGPIFDSARAVIKAKNLLGETYVELSRGSPASRLPDGGTIPLQHTLTPVELSQVLQTLDPSTRDHLVMLINSLGQSLAGRGPDLNLQAEDLKMLASDLDVISKTLVDNQAHFSELLSSLGKIMDTLAAYHSEFRQLIADWDRLMRALAANEADLEGAITEDAHVMAIFDQALAGNAQGLNGALAEGPRTVDNLSGYLGKGSVIFGQLGTEVPDIDQVFNELASAFSATDPNGDHMWRVYCVGGPSAPNPPAVTPQTPCFQGSP